MQTIKVKYVGLLDVFHDHLYDTGDWIKGEPKEVEDYQAMQLLRHPEFEDARHHKQRGPIDAVIPEKQIEEPDTHEMPPLQSLETMTKADIAAFAKRNFGFELSTEFKKSEMIDKVRFAMGRK